MVKVCQKAALKGHTDILECTNIFWIRYSDFMEGLVKEGNLEMIQYFYDKLPETFDFWD